MSRRYPPDPTDKHYSPDGKPAAPEVAVLNASPSPWLVANTIANVLIAAVLIGLLLAGWISTWG